MRTKSCIVGERRFAVRLLVLFALLAAVISSAHAQQSPDLSQVKVELAVRLPNGQPLVHTGVVIKIAGGSSFRPPIPDVQVTTDDQGVARFEIPAGVYSMSVVVHQIGEGSIGVTEFAPGKIVRPAMSPLAGYGSLDITVPSGCGDNVIVTAGSKEYPLQPGSTKQLHIDDLPAGKLSILAAINSGPQSWQYSPCSN